MGVVLVIGLTGVQGQQPGLSEALGLRPSQDQFLKPCGSTGLICDIRPHSCDETLEYCDPCSRECSWEHLDNLLFDKEEKKKNCRRRCPCKCLKYTLKIILYTHYPSTLIISHTRVYQMVAYYMYLCVCRLHGTSEQRGDNHGDDHTQPLTTLYTGT